MTKSIRHRRVYQLAKERIRKALKNDNVKEVTGTNVGNPRLIIHLRNGNKLVYRGKIVMPLHKFIFKKRYCKDEMPEVIDEYVV